MEKDGFFVQIKDMVEEYVDDRILLLKLQATEKAAKASATLFLGVMVTFISLVLFMIISFIAGYYLSQAVNSYPGGFGILAGIYILLIFLLVYLHKKYTGKMIIDSIIKFSFDSKEKWTNEV
ncbi:MAG: phage holin family protein [Segetibacter sp.]|jgi:preprotein translocase subunit SecG|nr:phage holin family protein [Segetibacter sp.]